MALTQEQTNIDLAFKKVGADVKQIKIDIGNKADASALANKADLSGGKLLTSQLPDIAIVDYLGEVASQAAMLALVGQKGDWCIRTDDSKVYIVIGTPTSTAASWKALVYPGTVQPDNYSYVGAYNAALV